MAPRALKDPSTRHHTAEHPEDFGLAGPRHQRAFFTTRTAAKSTHGSRAVRGTQCQGIRACHRCARSSPSTMHSVCTHSLRHFDCNRLHVSASHLRVLNNAHSEALCSPQIFDRSSVWCSADSPHCALGALFSLLSLGDHLGPTPVVMGPPATRSRAQRGAGRRDRTPKAVTVAA